MYPKPIYRDLKGLRQSGVGLPATIFIIAILSMIVLSMSEMVEDSQQGFAQDFQSSRAFYAAESGAQIALNRVFVGGSACNASLADIDFDAGGTNSGLDDCEAEIECAVDTVSGTDYLTFTSTATCGSGQELARRSIQVRAHQ